MITDKYFLPKTFSARFDTIATGLRAVLAKATLKSGRWDEEGLTTHRILTDAFYGHAQPPHVESDSTRSLRRSSVEAGVSSAIASRALAALMVHYTKKD
jgi:hypothetical protein